MKERKENSLKKNIIKIIEAALDICVGVILAVFIIWHLCLHWEMEKEVWFSIIISFIILFYKIVKKRGKSLINIISAFFSTGIIFGIGAFSIWLNVEKYTISIILGVSLMLSNCSLMVPKEDSKILRMIKILGCFAAYIIFTLILFFVFKTFQ